ncbi:SMP-30/gluconolactonase/LRE family protein [Flavobacteriaceae bacterium XHP0103]|uniref:SMP-30/gluconolactonase/LRE family protein n=1 Tax=Marixanthotalea marina TaxID=2844359 RepID=UPI002989CCD7|nr:SMP-30/gluconolactonase/LRE family protein [Marixanthotalea marina]MBU3822761.1 SMP-30/gluconolactonase/LRE family protein [Marixanthotalea marina]
MNLKLTKQILNSILLAVAIFTFIQCKESNTPEWHAVNQELISQHELTVRELSGLPDSNVASNLEAGKVKNLNNVDSLQLNEGITAKIFWGSGTMVSVIEAAPNTSIPETVLPSDSFIFIQEGSVNLSINGKTETLVNIKREAPDGTHSGTPKTNFVYLEKGTKSGLVAGDAGAKILEVSSPLRLDYLKKLGIDNLPSNIADVQNTQEPNLESNTVYDLYDFQLTKLADGAYSRLISGRNTQLSFISMDPGSTFPHHIHPEEQMMFVLRGECDEIILDGTAHMAENDVVRLPGNMVHGAYISELGCDALDIFWPARADYLEKEKAALAAYHAIIPEDATPELLVDGSKTEPTLTFSEGPKWMDGKVYFSNMYFDQNWNADPSKSSIVELSPDGSYKNITQGKMQANGLYPYKNGNLIVCDMIGHRVVEMTTEGKVVRVLVDKYDGKSIDGPNDVITDAKGGFYFTDPQFTMEAEKFQPGRAVYYVSPEGKITRITEPNEFAMPNGILLSPDGKTLYINNCYDDESWYPVSSEKDNYIWAYDVNEDGTISNGRQFAKLFLTEDVLNRKGRSSSADGMAIDKMGNIYVGTYYGVQIFNNTGEYVGMINLPSFPVSLCFGDEDMKTLYMVSYSKVYKIRTNMEGYINYL